MRKTTSLLLLLCSSVLFAENQPPRLIVQIVVDQLRGDLIHQNQSNFGVEGFNYLLSHGIDYQNAHHPHAFTVTCVGHATIATGSYPALHGIVANNWYNHDTKQDTYCAEDLNSHILPTTRTKKELPGRSPSQLLASTTSDEIVLAKKGRAFAVSLKDRAAIMLAGHAGKAFWFDKENGGFVSSEHYYSSYPQWVKEWNNHYEAKNETWTLSNPIATYRFAKSPLFENRFPTFGQTFPHHTGEPNDPLYYKFLSITPNADELTADFAIQLLKQEKLGKNADKTDYLAISFSATDAIGHQFGPNSLESEDNLRRLDKTLAKLLNAINNEAGLQNTLIVLTADHGVSDAPNYLAAHNLPENMKPNVLRLRKTIEDTLVHQFSLPKETLQAINLPYIYLDHNEINKHRLHLPEVSEKLAKIVSQQAGVFQAYPLPLSRTAKGWLSTKVEKMAFPNRAGDIYIVPPPYQSLAEQTVRVDHGTPWRYDSYVPLLFVNPGFKALRISKPVSTTDIAATVAAILQIKEPSASVGSPLQAVMSFYEGKA